MSSDYGPWGQIHEANDADAKPVQLTSAMAIALTIAYSCFRSSGASPRGAEMGDDMTLRALLEADLLEVATRDLALLPQAAAYRITAKGAYVLAQALRERPDLIAPTSPSVIRRKDEF